jgi:alginate O-acetyltransferase complex protein AlgI
MAFISLAFVAFFLVVLAGLRLAPTRYLRQGLLLLASVWFYASWKLAYLPVLAAPIIIDYVCAIRIENSADPAVRKRWLVTGVASNLLLLGFFKYTNFFLENVAALLRTAPKHLDIVLPLGISFFTFKTLSYLIDVYRGDLPACRSAWRYALFVSYFPDLIAGPIVRASVFLPQMKRSLRPSWPRAVVGCQMILLGLTKKLVIADQLAIVVDTVFAEAGVYSPLTVWSGVIAYSLQIYCDFSGYSDMAIGMSHIIGIDLPENFNMPYLALSPIEFWQRWHITLSNWLRDYLYYSLPGLRRGRWNRYRNAAITALLGGLWHGASWTFVGWGALHGLGLGVSHWWIRRRARLGRQPNNSISVRLACWLATYLFICVTWVFFRSQSLPAALIILRKMSGLAPGGIVWVYSPLLLVLPLVIGGHMAGILAARRAESRSISGSYVLLPLPGFVGAFVGASWLLVLALFGATGAHPFVYFQF